MPGLTVTEKEHWKDRIAKRIDKRIETISAQEPNLMDRVHRQARERALASLGLSQLQAELDQVDREQKALQRREAALDRQMLAQVRGVPPETIDPNDMYRHDQEVNRAIETRAKVHEDDLLAESETGRKILELRNERDNLLDTVWLATSSAQMKTLWSKVAELLGDEHTPLQRDALAIPPVEN